MSDFETISPLDLDEVTTGDHVIVAFDDTTGEAKKQTVTGNVETRIAQNESDITDLESDKADKITSGTENNIVTIDGSENIKDSGVAIFSRTISTDEPSGGSNGDVWYEVE